MQITVAQISQLINGEVVGDGNATVCKIAKIEEGEPGALSFLANPKYESHIYETRSTAVIVNRTFMPSSIVNATLIKVDDAYASFTFLLEKFANNMSAKSGIEKTAVVSEKATVGKNVYIGALTYVGEGVTIGDDSKIYPQVFIGDNVRIGKNCMIYSGVNIYHDTVIGDNCIIHSGTVIGSDGFGFAPLPDKSYKKIPQTGNVVIENDVEIGSNCSIDRATMGSTYIRKGVKMDNLVQVAHNVEIGEHTVMASQSGVAGSTKIGKHCVIAGQVGIIGHITIADGSMIGAQSGISGSLKKNNEKWFGSPAIEYNKALRSYAVFRNLPELDKKVKDLEKIIKELKNNK